MKVAKTSLSLILPSYSLQNKADKTMNLCNSQLPWTRVVGENNFVSLSIIYSLPILALNLCRAGHKAITPTSEEFWWGSAQKWSTLNLLNLKFVLQNETHADGQLKQTVSWMHACPQTCLCQQHISLSSTNTSYLSVRLPHFTLQETVRERVKESRWMCYYQAFKH